MSIWPRFIPVEGTKDLINLKKKKLLIRRKGSNREGYVVEIIGERVTIKYPAYLKKRESYCSIPRFENYELEPTLLMEEYFGQLVAMIEGHKWGVPKYQEDRPDLDVLGIFLENDFLAWCLYGGGSTGQQAQVIKLKASQIITEAVNSIEQFGNDTGQLDAQKTNQAKLEEIKKNKLYFIETSLRILFWCYYCEIKRIPGSERYNNDTTTATAKIMGNNTLPLSLRFRAARIMYFWSETNDKKVSSSEKDQATNFLARIAGLTPEQITGTEFSTNRKEIIQLAKYDLSDETGKRPEYFF